MQPTAIRNEYDLSAARSILRNPDVNQDVKDRIQTIIYLYLKKQKQRRQELQEEE